MIFDIWYHALSWSWRYHRLRSVRWRTGGEGLSFWWYWLYRDDTVMATSVLGRRYKRIRESLFSGRSNSRQEQACQARVGVFCPSEKVSSVLSRLRLILTLLTFQFFFGAPSSGSEEYGAVMEPSSPRTMTSWPGHVGHLTCNKKNIKIYSYISCQVVVSVFMYVTLHCKKLK